MDYARLDEKLAEARRFLDQMVELDRRISGDKRPINYYLSGFLSATMSLRKGFQVRQNRIRNAAVKDWCKKWIDNLTPDEKQLYDFIGTARNDEVHAGSPAKLVQDTIEFDIGEHNTGDARHYVSGPPGTPPVVTSTQTYKLTINGIECRATKACADYLALLKRMVTQIKTELP
jgi:hypothetical protein